TGGVLLDNTAQSPSWRQFTPFGAPRGASLVWPDNRGSLNKPRDTNTGLTSARARYYDPVLCRLLRLDPPTVVGEPQQWDGYTYASHNPITLSDPTGLCWSCIGDFLSGVKDGWNNWGIDTLNSVITFVNDPIGSITNLNKQATDWNRRVHQP